jgi:hypothetical protein
MFYSWGWNLLGSMIKNNGKMTEEMIEDMTLQEGETELYIQRFLEHFKKREDAMVVKNADNYYYAVKNSLWATFRKDVCLCALAYGFGETCAIGYTSFLIIMINYLKDDEASIGQGLLLLVIFGALMSVGAIFKNYFVFYGM